MHIKRREGERDRWREETYLAEEEVNARFTWGVVADFL